VLLQCRAYLCILSNQVSDRRKIILCLLVGPNLSMGLGESFDGAPGNITAAKRYSCAFRCTITKLHAMCAKLLSVSPEKAYATWQLNGCSCPGQGLYRSWLAPKNR